MDEVYMKAIVDERWLNANVTLPMERVIATAVLAGGQDADVCPPTGAECWLQRDQQPYLHGVSSIETECTECWLAYLLRGE